MIKKRYLKKKKWPRRGLDLKLHRGSFRSTSSQNPCAVYKGGKYRHHRSQDTSLGLIYNDENINQKPHTKCDSHSHLAGALWHVPVRAALIDLLRKTKKKTKMKLEIQSLLVAVYQIEK